MYKPPFEMTSHIIRALTEIATCLGRYEGLLAPAPKPQLRKQNRIRTIQGTLAIEGNTLSESQVTAILDGKRVAGSQRDVREVVNAIKAYDSVTQLDPFVLKDLLAAHAMMMTGLVDDAGKFRTTNVGVIKGKKVTHVAPKSSLVHNLMRELFSFLKSDRETPILVKACAFHYELEFIHPFSDGNGRMGRFWQLLISLKEHRIFEMIPVESLIRARQLEYYKVLRECDKQGSSTRFIEFSLDILRQGLSEVLKDVRPVRQLAVDRLAVAKDRFSKRRFTRKEYAQLFASISTATASRDLALGVKSGVLLKTGDKSEATYVVASNPAG